MRNAKKLVIIFLQEYFFIYLKNVFLWIDWIYAKADCVKVSGIRKFSTIKKIKKNKLKKLFFNPKKLKIQIR